jgi:hypothetical protein
MQREIVKFVLGFLLIVAGPIYMSGGIPWITPIFLAAIAFEFWRRRRYLQRISDKPELLAADRRWHTQGEWAAVAILVGFALSGAAFTLNPTPNLIVGFAGLGILMLGIGLLIYRTAWSGNWRTFALCAAITTIVTVALFLRQTLVFS